jgi:hypothetical protein
MNNKLVVSTSSGGYLKRRNNRGRLRTSASSASCEREVTAVKSSRRHFAITCPGGPAGLRKADTQTLVSSRATSSTASCLHLGPRLSHFCLDSSLGDSFSATPHPTKQALELLLPLPLSIDRDQDFGPFFQADWFQRSQQSVLVHRPERFFRWRRSSRFSHRGHSNGAPSGRGQQAPRRWLSPLALPWSGRRNSSC